MSAVRLSTTSYVVLGMLALRGPSTPYDLKRAIGHSVGYFWSFPHAQLYSEPQRLAELGLLELSLEEDGRRRKTFTITEKGRKALRGWLAEPTNEHFEIRDVAELKLFFSEAGDPGNVLELAHEQVKQHEERIAVYEAMQRRFGQRPEVASRMVSLQLGLEMERAALRFWTALSDELNSGAASALPAEYLRALMGRLNRPNGG
jgi:PadR family transcriptional regulator AphA